MNLSRRELLHLVGAGFGVAAGAAVVGGCGAASTSAVGPVLGAGAGTPQRGGAVRFAFTGGGPAETLDPFAAGTPADYARNRTVYDQLFAMQDGQAVPRLGVTAEPAADARSFTLRLRDDVTWHDGSPLRAADVGHTLAYLAAPQRPFPSELTSYLDIAGVQVRDEHTLVIPTLQPVGDPATLFAAAGTSVIKDGSSSFAPADVVGTGPFTVAAFEPGRESRLRRFDDHWDGAPFADELVILSLSDPAARVNAVRGGQADYASDIPYTVARTGAGAPGLEIRSAGENQRTGYGFVLNTTLPPFDDPRARRAIRLAVDRRALVDTVFLGFGVAGNDLFGAGARYFAADIPPPAHDVEQARRLLEQAGAAGARIVIRSADYETGMNASTELFVEQLRGIGLDAQPVIVGPTEYFDADALAEANVLAFTLGPFPLQVDYTRSAAYPSIAFPDPELQAAVATALSTVEEAERERAWRTAQEVMADRGNWLVWGLGDTLSLARSTVAGVQVQDSAKYPYLGKVGLTA